LTEDSAIVNVLPDDLILRKGAHATREDGVCVLEAAAWMAGEEHGDKPKCVCPVISAFVRSWNDILSTDEARTRLLKPLLPKIIGTRSTKEVELRRAMLCVDWSCREWLPTLLEFSPECIESAKALRAAKPIQEWADFDIVVPLIIEAQKKAHAAARAAAAAAALAAAWASVRDDAWAAEWAAARAAAAAAASETLVAPAVDALRQSTVKLVERMCEVK